MLTRFLKSSLVFGLIFVVTGFVIIFFWGRSITVTCNRAPNLRVSCTSESKLLGLFRVDKDVIAGLEAAWVDESCDEDGCTYCVVLTTSRGEVRPDSTYDSTYASKVDLAGRINSFLQGTEEETVAFQFTKGFVLTVFGGIFALAGLWLIIGSARAGRLMEP
ncbi:MAG: hypothetical protein PVJ07_01660 [Anaerolineales bacterium]|jgi:hypothetical protein